MTHEQADYYMGVGENYSGRRLVIYRAQLLTDLYPGKFSSPAGVHQRSGPTAVQCGGDVETFWTCRTKDRVARASAS
jgi:hypothetical protein